MGDRARAVQQGFNTIALVSVAVAAVGSVAGYALVRSRDFVAAGGPAAGSAETGGRMRAARRGRRGFRPSPHGPVSGPCHPRGVVDHFDRFSGAAVTALIAERAVRPPGL